MMNITKTFWGVALALVVAYASGCYMLPSIWAPTEDEKIPNIERPSIKKNTMLSLVLRDGTTRRGKFRGLSRYSKEQYALKYDEARKQEDLLGFPDIGEYVSITSTRDNRYEFEFVGFDRGAMVLSALDTGLETRLGFATIREVQDQQAKVIKAERLRELDSQGRLPSLSAVDLLIDKSVATTPMDQIQEMTIPGRKGSMTAVVISATILGAVMWYAAFGR